MTWFTIEILTLWHAQTIKYWVNFCVPSTANARYNTWYLMPSFSLWMPSSTVGLSLICHRRDSEPVALGTGRKRRGLSRKTLTWSWLSQNCVPLCFYPSSLSRESDLEDGAPWQYHLWSSLTEPEHINTFKHYLDFCKDKWWKWKLASMSETWTS